VSKSKAQEQERTEAIGKLRKMLRPGDVLYTVVRHVSASGMSRSISVLRVTRGATGRPPEVESLDFWVSRAVKEKIDRKHGGVVQSGGGMDMGFHLVYLLGRCLWPDGTPKPHGTRNGKPDSDGGYALKHEVV
jgi:hypothetical protein